MGGALETTVHEAARPCLDEECPGTGEVERDGEHAYFECGECGSTWGFRRVEQADDGTCAIGVPEEVRRAASVAAEREIRRTTPVVVQIGRRPDGAG